MKISILTIIGLSIFTIIIPIYANAEVRSDIYNLSQNEIILDGINFSGFYYNIDDNSVTEKLALSLSNISPSGASATLGDQPDALGNRGVVYTTEAQPADFDFGPWGRYEKIRFLADDYLAAYDSNLTETMNETHQVIPILYYKSTNRNLLTNEQISKILVDDSTEQNINSSKPLKLEEGYQLAIKAMDIGSKKAQVELSKNGQVVDSKVIPLSLENGNIGDETYYYAKDLGNTKAIVILAVHLASVSSGPNVSDVRVDGVFQISDTPTQLKAGQVDPNALTIKMDNNDGKLTLSKNKDIPLMQNIYIKTADQDVIDARNPLRYYVYTTKPGTYELHGSVANLSLGQFTWTNATFPGFYYDIGKNIGSEKITFRLSNVNPVSAILSDQTDSSNNRGVVYTTKAQNQDFKFKPWGQYKVIGFLAEKYFAAYDHTVTQNMQNVSETVACLYDNSKNRNLMSNEQISKVLMDTDTESTITSTIPLKLEEGYQLAIKSIDMDGKKVYLELSKNEEVVDSKVVQPSISNAKMSDCTYYYKVDLGDTKEIIQIAVHFKNAFAGSDTNIATVDGIFQISDTPISLKADQHYDKMSVKEVNPTALTIKMDNKDNNITLSKDEYIHLMGNIYIRTADQYDLRADNPLRYYLFMYETVEGEAHPIEEAATEKTKVKEVVESVNAKNETTNDDMTSKTFASKDARNTTFKARLSSWTQLLIYCTFISFIIIGLLAVIYHILSKKQ